MKKLRCGTAARRGDEGFSLVELLVSLIVMAEVMTGLAMLFDSSTKLARAQTHVAELQQSMRVGQSELIRFVRMAGIGGLPITRLNLPGAEPDADSPNYDLLGAFPRSGYAVSVINNVGEGTIIQTVDPDSTVVGNEMVPGSDVLVLRGVFSTPLYYFDPPLDISGWLDVLPVEDQEVTIPDRMRVVGQDWEDYPQDIAALGARLLDAKNATVAAHRTVALILRDTLNPNAYAIIEFDSANTPAGISRPRPGLARRLRRVPIRRSASSSSWASIRIPSRGRPMVS